MSQSWTQRVAEGVVVGIAASVMFAVFSSMDAAREELSSAKETLDIQLEVNQGLLDKTDAMEMRLMRLDRRVDRLSEAGPMFGPTVGSAPQSSENTSEPSEVPSIVSEMSDILSQRTVPEPKQVSPPRALDLQERIDQQRQIRQ